MNTTMFQMHRSRLNDRYNLVMPSFDIFIYQGVFSLHVMIRFRVWLHLLGAISKISISKFQPEPKEFRPPWSPAVCWRAEAKAKVPCMVGAASCTSLTLAGITDLTFPIKNCSKFKIVPFHFNSVDIRPNDLKV